VPRSSPNRVFLLTIIVHFILLASTKFSLAISCSTSSVIFINALILAIAPNYSINLELFVWRRFIWCEFCSFNYAHYSNLTAKMLHFFIKQTSFIYTVYIVCHFIWIALLLLITQVSVTFLLIFSKAYILKLHLTTMQCAIFRI